MYGEDAVTDRICQKQFAKFLVGYSSLDDTSWPAEVDSDQIENSKLYTMQEIAYILKISKSTTLLVKIKNVSFVSWKKLKGLFGQPSNS